MSGLQPAWRLVKRLGWYRAPTSSLRHRLWAIAYRGGPWYDWGRPVMALIGQARHGDYEAPRGRDLWYLPATLHAAAKNPVTTYRYEDVLAFPEGEWKVLDSQDDGRTLVLAWWPQPGGDGRITRADVEGAEIGLLRRWLVWECWIRAEWFGLRPWIYYRALHASVHLQKPFACNAVPPRGTGGYSHWHCQLRRHHTTDHRVRNYTWPLAGGSVTYEPEEAHR